MNFMDKSDVPKDENGQTKYEYLSTDCFHPSQLGHARAANSYWNSMLASEDKRETEWKQEFKEFRCPTEENPFLKTSKN